MALTDGVGGTLNTLAGGGLNVVILILVLVLVVGVVLGIGWAIRRSKRFKQFKVIIWEVLENGSIREGYDNAGIFVSSKTGNKLFYLKRNGVGLKPDNVSFVVNGKGQRVVYLLRYGYKNFIFINPVFSGNKPVFKVGEEDVNWAINSYEANKKRFSQSLLMQILPFVVLALISIIILVMMIYLFKQFSVFKDVAMSIAQASQAFANHVPANMSQFTTSGGII